MQESILEYLQRKLREVGSAHWEELANDAEVPPSLPRKVAYERKNPGVNTVEPLYNYFKSVEAGDRLYPWDRPANRRSGADRRSGNDRRKTARA